MGLRDRLKPRLDALEAQMAPACQRWVRIFQHAGQTQEQAIAAYEAEHGPIGDASVILRVSVKPSFPVPHAVA